MIGIEREWLELFFRFPSVTGRFWETAVLGGGVRHILALSKGVSDPPVKAVQTGVLNHRDPALEPKGGIFGYTGPVSGYLKPRCGQDRPFYR